MKHLIFIAILSFPFLSIAQDCIDESAINPGCICPLIYNPVCGCDGIMYDNSCIATQCAGVTSYVSAYDENGILIDCSSLVEPTNCDLITVEFGGFTYSPLAGAIVLELNISSNLPNDVYYAYAGFVIMDNDNQLVAYEPEDALNVYGFGGVYSETRYLVLDGMFNFPFEGSVQLISGYFADNELLECTFPISISFEGDVNLAGQYYLDSEFDYIDITENLFSVYDFEDDFLCYELIEFEYEANDSIIILWDAIAEEQLMLFYEFGDNLNLLMEGDIFELVDTTFNADEWFECGSCYIYDVIAQAGECDSAGNFMVEIDFTVQNPQAAGFTVVGNGVTYGNFDYNQASYMIGPLAGDGTTPYEFVVRDNDDNSCSDFYELGIVDCSGTSDIISNQAVSKKLLSIKNILGETITSPKFNTPYIYFYDDGSYEKKVIFVQ